MSGNPFRRQQQTQPAPAWYSGDETSTSRQSPPPGQPRKSSVVKRVRIQTPPPLSPDSVYEEDVEDPAVTRIWDENHEGSPSPDPGRISPSPLPPPQVKDEDPLSRTGIEDDLSANEETTDNTRLNSARVNVTTVDVEDIAPGIKNPFARTLASMEPSQAGVRPREEEEASTSQTASTPGGKRGTMDVDSFKRLLMTGQKGPSAAESSPASSTAAVTSSSYFTGSSNSTDTSSMSRQSINEPSNEIKPTSPDELEDASSSDDEDTGRTAPLPSSVPKIKPPPPPRPRHGKIVTQARTPQVVSFSDFTSSDATPESTKTLPNPVTLPPRKTSDETSDLTWGNITSTRASSGASSQDEQPTATAVPPAEHSSDLSAQRAPPLVPPSRPASQLNTITEQQQRLSVSTVQSSRKSIPQPSTVSPPPISSSRLSKPPPPPPTRRSTAKLTTSSEPFPPTLEQTEESSNAASRSSSIASHHRASIPPPPPPRRRGSSKSSIDSISLSRAGVPSLPSPRPSIDAARRPSTGSVERNADSPRTVETRNNSGDLLAEMAALQAEIDALRAQHK